MSYDYKTERHRLESDAGQRCVYEALLDAQHMSQANGLIPHEALAAKIHMGDSFGPLVVIDRLIETGYLRRADNGDSSIARQAWIYRWVARSRT